MIGFPKNLNSKFDYEYIRGNFPKEKWIGLFQNLLNERMQWFNIGKLDKKEDGITDDTHKIIENQEQGEQLAEYYQYELKEDQNCQLYKLGFTVKEVESILNQ